MSAEIIHRYFPDLPTPTKDKFDRLQALYEEWNAKINVVSRKDIDKLYERHILHSLAIAKVIQFTPGSEILDVGTGGGFPGIPLAILFPQCNFHLVDSIGKKIKVVNAVAEALDLRNVKGSHMRAEQVKKKYDFVVSRAVTALPAFMTFIRGKIKQQQINSLPNGLLYLKGGEFKEELKSINYDSEVYDISKFFEGEFFESKKVVYVRMV